MDQLSTPNSIVCRDKIDSHSGNGSTKSFFNCLSKDSSSKLKEERSSCQISNIEIERRHIRRSSCDDIISKELPKNILDTDFDDKCDEIDNDMLTITNSGNSLINEQSQLVDNVEGHRKISIENLIQNELSVKNSIRILSSGQNLETNSMLNGNETVNESVKIESSIPDEISDTSENKNCESKLDHLLADPGILNEIATNMSSFTKSDDISDFIPTIIDIRGACPCPTDNVPSNSSISIVRIKGNCTKDNQSANSVKSDDVVVVSEGNSEFCLNSNNQISQCTILNVRKEPQETVVNKIVNGESQDTTFTSEIFLDDVRVENQNDDEVILLETSSKVPSPIPIKVETHDNVPPEVNELKIIDDLTSIADKIQSTEVAECSSSYTCHLCNTTFSQHDSLNEHMALHRHNLVKMNVYSKTRPKGKPICPVCNRHLNTWQALQQHIIIHNNEKSYECLKCHKIFRHLSNYKLHMQKHEAEKKALEKLRLKESMARPRPTAKSFNFRGSLLLKEKVAKKEAEVSKLTNNKNIIVSTPKRLAFDSSAYHSRNNTKENSPVFHRSLLNKSKSVADLDDDVIPLKTFNNVENIVMNAARFIVKVDNIDPNILKRRIKTPDISIDKNTFCHRRVEKRKISLSIPDNNKRLKLDQIENIIMDDIPSEGDSVSGLTQNEDYDHDNSDDCVIVEDEGVEKSSNDKANEKLTNDELFNILNDTPGMSTSEIRPNFQSGQNEINENTCFKSNPPSRLSAINNAVSPHLSNVIMLKPRENDKKEAAVSSDVCVLDDDNGEQTQTYCGDYEVDDDDDDDDEVKKNDSYDNAFQRVAQRRLLLIQKRAAGNGGKIDNKYLMGPLFWRKALKRVKQNPIDFDVNNFSRSVLKRPVKLSNERSRIDDRRTNDPLKLQARAENKLNCIVDKVKKMDDLNVINLAGPKFWQKTLKLAGIHNPNNLKMLLMKQKLSLQDVEFVSDEEISKFRKEQLLFKETSESVENFSLPLIDLTNEAGNKHSKLVKPVESAKPVDVTTSSNQKSVKPKPTTSTTSILYESLTSPRKQSNGSKSTENEMAPVQKPKTVTKAGSKGCFIGLTKNSSNLPITAMPIAPLPQPVSVPEHTIPAPVENAELNTNIILNVDGEHLQLITTSDDKSDLIQEGSNYILVSDVSGAMRLVKERDLQIIESRADGTQYILNIPDGNEGSVQFAQEDDSDQATYALQLDGENYTAVQFVQNDENATDKKFLDDKTVETSDTSFVIQNSAADLNSISKELSDFLNLDYGTLLRTDNSDGAHR